MSARGGVLMVGVLVLAAACAGGDDTVATPTQSDMLSATAPPTTGPSPPTTVNASTREAALPNASAPGEWTVWAVPIVTYGIATQSNLSVEPPEIDALGRTSAGWFAVGTVNGGFTVWRSSDLSVFEPVHAEVCCQRSVDAWAIAELTGSLVIGGTEHMPDGASGAFLARSDDAGATWTPVDAPPLATGATRVASLINIGTTVLAEAVNDSGFAADWRSTLAWSDDLVTWTGVELPGALETDRPTLVHDDAVVFAVAPRSADDGTFVGWASWRSDDGGRTFGEVPALEEPGLGGFVVVAGSLVAIPSVLQGEHVHADAVGPAVLGDNNTWVRLPPDTGTWGDGRVAVSPTELGDGATPTFLVTRQSRASAHYCYVDVESCQQYESALITSPDGVTWSEFADVPGIEPRSFLGSTLAVRSDPDGIVVARASIGESAIHVTRWTSGATPPLVERPDYPPPDILVPLDTGATDVEVGTELRYVLGLGGCGGLSIGDQRWEPETPLPDPPPPEWPYRAVEISDGPAGYLYGRILRTAADSIEFLIEGIGPVATFHSAPPPEYLCG